MLLVSENGTGYADGHFHIDNGLIINNFTGRMVGRLISTREADNYLSMDKITKPSLIVTLCIWIVGVMEGFRYSFKKKSKEEERFFLAQAEMFFMEREK